MRIKTFVSYYLFWVLAFVLQKPLFMACYAKLMGGGGPMDWLRVMWHGMPLDLAMAGYLTIVPALLLIVSCFWMKPVLRSIYQVYNIVVSAVVALTLVVNLALYNFWGFPLDSTPLFYFFSSPRLALASVSWWIVLLGVALVVMMALVLYFCTEHLPMPRYRCRQWWKPVALVLLTALLFLPIRGGVTVSTTNSGEVYFSKNQHLNHAAVNPLFRLMESLTKTSNFGKQYRFMSDATVNRLVKPLLCTQSNSTRLLITNRHPQDVYIIILESFSWLLMQNTPATPNLKKLAAEGVLFDNFYANSFRTDRGVLSVLSGYPAQPTMSLMRYPDKTGHLPSIARQMNEAGYALKYFYGGDIDFCNQRSYLVAQGFEQIVSDKSFPVSQRLSKWGVHDEFVFRRVESELKKQHHAMLRVIQTSSSHEPFEVPRQLLPAKYGKALNAFAYADHCLGDFVNYLKQHGRWKNALLVIVPDHLGAWPEGIDNLTLPRFHVPLIFAGGVVEQPRTIHTLGSQQDIAATLLAQLGIDHSQLTFSKDMMSSKAPHFAFFSIPDAMGLVTPGGAVIYDNETRRPALAVGRDARKNEARAKAYLQYLYNDIAKR